LLVGEEDAGEEEEDEEEWEEGEEEGGVEVEELLGAVGDAALFDDDEDLDDLPDD